MKLWGRASSINVQKVLWTLEELQLDYTRVDLGGQYGGLDDPAYRALNPNGRVPTLEDGDVVVWESNAVVRYLGAAYDPGGLWPQEPGRRAAADRWMDWSITTPYADLIACFWHTVRLPPSKRDRSVVKEAANRLRGPFGLLEAIMAGREWLAAGRFTMADIAVGALLYRYFEMPLDRAALPNLEAWYARLAARPAYARTVMTGFEELRGRD